MLIDEYVFRGDCQITKTVCLGIVDVSGPCFYCKAPQTVTVPEKGLALLRGGGLIQDCFPGTPPDEREFLLSGCCGTCWDEMFEEEEEPEEEEDA